jgi:hypothetical protein
MHLALCLAFTLAVLPFAVAAAAPEALFLGRAVYLTAADCPAFRKNAAGGSRPPTTVLTTLTAKGYASGGTVCTFSNIDERYKGRIWTATLVCTTEGNTDSVRRTEVWRRQPDGALAVTVGKTSTTWVACAADRQPANKP